MDKRAEWLNELIALEPKSGVFTASAGYAEADWDPDLHPRDEAGRFSDAGGSTGGTERADLFHRDAERSCDTCTRDLGAGPVQVDIGDEFKLDGGTVDDAERALGTAKYVISEYGLDNVTSIRFGNVKNNGGANRQDGAVFIGAQTPWDERIAEVEAKAEEAATMVAHMRFRQGEGSESEQRAYIKAADTLAAESLQYAERARAMAVHDDYTSATAQEHSLYRFEDLYEATTLHEMGHQWGFKYGQQADSSDGPFTRALRDEFGSGSLRPAYQGAAPTARARDNSQEWEAEVFTILVSGRGEVDARISRAFERAMFGGGDQ